jgi:hypothetical protein
MPLPPKANTPANYALLSTDTMLSLDGEVMREEGARFIYAKDGVDVSAMELVGDELVIDFLAPTDLESDAGFGKTLRDFLSYYEPIRRGWLRYREPARRDPRPALEANLEMMLGQATFERRQKTKPKPKAKKKPKSKSKSKTKTKAPSKKRK